MAYAGITYNAILVIIDLADIGKGRFFFFVVLLILVQVFFEDLRKLLNFSSCKNVVCESRGCSGYGVESDSLELLRITVVLVNVALKISLTCIGIFAKSVGSRETFGIELKNASLIFSAFGKAIKLFFLVLGKLIFIVSLCELSLKASYYSIVFLYLLRKTVFAKTLESGERSDSAKTCRLANRHTKNLTILGIAVIIDKGILILNVGAGGNGNAIACYIAANVVVNNIFGIGNFFYNTARAKTVGDGGIILSNNTACAIAGNNRFGNSVLQGLDSFNGTDRLSAGIGGSVSALGTRGLNVCRLAGSVKLCQFTVGLSLCVIGSFDIYVAGSVDMLLRFNKFGCCIGDGGFILSNAAFRGDIGSVSSLAGRRGNVSEINSILLAHSTAKLINIFLKKVSVFLKKLGNIVSDIIFSCRS